MFLSLSIVKNFATVYLNLQCDRTLLMFICVFFLFLKVSKVPWYWRCYLAQWAPELDQKQWPEDINSRQTFSKIEVTNMSITLQLIKIHMTWISYLNKKDVSRKVAAFETHCEDKSHFFKWMWMNENFHKWMWSSAQLELCWWWKSFWCFCFSKLLNHTSRASAQQKMSHSHFEDDAQS